MMKAEAAKTEFLKWLSSRGEDLPTLLVPIGIEAMLDFYATERVEGCDLDNDGDMLLFQWGVHDWETGRPFK